MAIWDAWGVTRPGRPSGGAGGFRGKPNSNSVWPPRRPVATIVACQLELHLAGSFSLFLAIWDAGGVTKPGRRSEGAEGFRSARRCARWWLCQHELNLAGDSSYSWQIGMRGG